VTSPNNRLHTCRVYGVIRDRLGDYSATDAYRLGSRRLDSAGWRQSPVRFRSFAEYWYEGRRVRFPLILGYGMNKSKDIANSGEQRHGSSPLVKPHRNMCLRGT